MSLYAQISYRDGKLSISGVEGPRPNGDAFGSCGQIIMEEWNITSYAPGWDAEKVARFREVWERWHLNDMRASCEHQRGWDTTRKVEIVTYQLTSEALREQDAAKKYVLETAAATGHVELSDGTRELLQLPWNTTTAPDVDGPGGGRYEVKKREQKALGWLRQEEHPEGMLSRPCDVCGYKYGTSWLREEVPADILDFLAALPDADIRIPAAWARFDS